MRFYDREVELGMIRDSMKRDHCFFVITGRRRIGKTRLVREALKGPDLLEFFIPRKRMTLALEQLSRSLKDQTDYSPSFVTIGEFFEYIFRLDGKVLFIDELSNLEYMDKGAFSDLQMMIDRYKDERRIRLIVDGSYASVMKKIFEDRKEPLFGRSTNLLELKPLPAKYSIMILKDGGFSFIDSLEIYTLLGGVPRYLELIRYYNNMEEIRKGIFSPGSIFLPEGENVLIQEFGRSWDTHFSILEVISRGKYGPTDIANQLGMEVQMLPKYLKTLNEIGLIKRKNPVFGKERHVRYVIDDPFFQFWFSVCYPKIDLFRNTRSEIDKTSFRESIGRGMEDVIRIILHETGSIPFDPDGSGSWWDRKGHEVDILIHSKKEKALLLGEVKWRNRPAGADVVTGLLENLNRIDWYNSTRIEYAFIVSRNGFTDEAEKLMKEEKVLGITPKDLEGVIMKERSLDWIVRKTITNS